MELGSWQLEAAWLKLADGKPSFGSRVLALGLGWSLWEQGARFGSRVVALGVGRYVCAWIA